MNTAYTGSARALGLLLLLTLCLLVQASKSPTALEQVLSRGTLKVIASNGPTTFYEGPEGYTGFEYQLVSAFANYLGVELELVESNTQSYAFGLLAEQQGDLISAGLAATEQTPNASVLYSASYLTTTAELIYHAGNTKPETLDEAQQLSDSAIILGDHNGHQQTFAQLEQAQADLAWQITEDADSFELLEKVHNNEISHAVVDSHVFLMNQGLFSQARIAFDLGQPHGLAWAFRNQQDQTLLAEANRFLENFHHSGELAQLQERYFGHLQELHSQGTKMFSQRIDSRLPKYKPLMQEAARDNKLDWHMLAAISYQESFWNPKAKSPTGVRGLMMLTRNTAKEVGVDNRLDPQQSIFGGASYFAKQRERLPESIQEPDRSWMALAAYNVGMGHLEDARKLTQRLGGDPNLWQDVKNSLPLLQKKKYYSTLKHGYARGEEAAHYVQRIRHYYTVLSWHTRIRERKLALSQSNGLHKTGTGFESSYWLNHSIL